MEPIKQKINYIHPSDQKIFDLLLNVVKTKSPNTTLRVAGGWVRDLLLSMQSDDIDIAVDNMSGQDFAKLVVEYMNENNLNTKGVTVIKANPDQSKHLETAMISIFGRSIDFANLRKETYTSDSRIPTIEFGTPYEDASRRDLTINSLFYNINTCNVEDYIGGIKDLKEKIARTPIDPVQTFLDDPLRMLRIIRFASRFDLEVDETIIDAANVTQVRYALQDKVSSERIWKEYAGQREKNGSWKPGFICGNDPVKALKLVLQMHLQERLNINKHDIHLFIAMNHSLNDKEKLLVRNLYVLAKYKDHIPDTKIFKRLEALEGCFNSLNAPDPIVRRALCKLKNDWDIAVEIKAAYDSTVKSYLVKRIHSLIDEMGGLDVKLPLSGNDLIAAGLIGKDIGTVLKRIEEQWFLNPLISKEDALKVVEKSIKEFDARTVEEIIT